MLLPWYRAQNLDENSVRPSTPFLEWIVQETRYAIRALRRQPSFALTVILTLAIGIGATTTIFTLFDALVFRPLPVPHPERLAIVGDPAKVGWGWHGSPMIDYVSYPLYQDVKVGSRVFSALYAAGSVDVDLLAADTDPRTPEHPSTRAVSGSFFSVLEVSACAGRTFDEQDDRVGAPPVAVLSYSYWQRRFARERSVVGTTLDLNGVAVTVVGIAPRRFAGDIVGESTELWLPMSVVTQLPGSEKLLGDRSASWLQMMGRLAPGATLERARAEVKTVELNAVRSRLAGPALADFDHDIQTDTVQVGSGARGFSSQRGAYASALAILMAGVTLLALVICANLANLTLARGMARRRELTVRMTLGAGRRRLVGQLLTESSVIAVAAAILGLLASMWGTTGLMALAPSVSFLDLEPDRRVFAFTAAVTVFSVLLFGLVPALRASRVDIATTLRAQGRGTMGGHARLGRSLVAAQIAASSLLLLGAGLLVQSARRLLSAELGFDRAHVVVAHMHLGKTTYVGGRLEQYREQVERQALHVPGVLGASYTQEGLFGGGTSLGHVEIPGVVTPMDTASAIYYDRVGAGYLRSTGAALLRGRDFDARDEQPGANDAILDATMARAYFPARDPIGQVITLDSVSHTVVGVVRDMQERGVREAPVRRMYLSQPQPSTRPLSFELIIRTSGEPTRSVESLRRALRSVDQNVPFDLEPLSQRLRTAVREGLLLTNLTLGFGLATLVIAALGLYGVTAYATARRTSEFGLRAALGAPPASIAAMVLRDALAITVLGLGVGLPAGVIGTRLIRSQMFGVRAIDLPSLTVAVLTLVCAALVASWLPARRAAAASPVDALRAE
jgi:predicted permease